MICRFTVIKGQDDGKTFEVSDDQAVLLGRSSKSDVHIRDMGISRLHCQIVNRDQRCAVSDMNSKNGTRVNGTRITGEVELKSNDTVGIGTTLMRVEIVGAPVVEEVVEPAPFALSEAPPVPETVNDEALTIDEDSTLRPAKGQGESMLGSFDRWLEPGDAASPAPAAPPSDEEPDLVPVPEDEPEPITLRGDEEEAAEDAYIGRTIAGFAVLERLGGDSLSISYKARQVSMDRIVLLRILKDAMTRDQDAVQRFINAACSGGRLVHPHILQVYDAGEAGDSYYIALEYVEGRNVSELLLEKGAGHPLAARRALEIAGQIAKALDYAHQQGVVHGRVSPSVIYVTQHGIAKLAELGFARALVESGLEDENAQARRPVISQYVAPEQLAVPTTTDARSDIYSLGVVLYMMLSGRLPYAARGDALRARIAKGEAEPLQRANPFLPAPVCAAVSKAMAATPEGRYARATEFQAAIEKVLTTEQNL